MKGGESVDDNELIGLFEQRDARAVKETERAYGALCRAVALELTGDPQDAEEICNDTWLALWNAIPPEKPVSLAAFAAGIARNIAANRVRARLAQRRGSGEHPKPLSELAECVPSGENVEQEVDRRMLQAALDHFLRTLPEEACAVFVLRYTYALPIAEIAKRRGMTVGAVKISLHRTRKKLHAYLEQEELL